MTDLTSDLQSSGVPVLDFRTYVMKVFFPGVTDHPILNEAQVSCNYWGRMFVIMLFIKTTRVIQFELLLRI